MAWIEVVDNIAFDDAHAQIQTILYNNVEGYSATSWCRKIFGNGSGGYYIPIPDGLRGGSDDLEDFLLDYTIYDVLPNTSSPGSYTAIGVTDDILYAVDDFVDLGAPLVGTTVSEYWELVKPNGDKFFIALFRDGQVVIVDVADESYYYYDSGIFKPWKPIYDSGTDSIIFISAVGNSLFKYDVATAEVTYSVNDFSSGDPGGIVDRAMTTDGKVIMGTFNNPNPKLWLYNPTNNSISIAASFPLSVSGESVYTMGGDSTHSYAKLKLNGNYRIASIRKSDGEITFYGNYSDQFKGNSQIGLYHDNARNVDFWYGSASGSAIGSPSVSFKMINGVDDPTLSADVHLEDIDQGYLPYSKSEPSNWTIDYDYSLVAGVESSQSKLSYNNGSPVTLTFTEVYFESFALGRFAANNDNSRILGAYAAYGPVFTWNPTTDEVDLTKPGFGVSVYDFFDIDGTNYLFGGYPSESRLWDSGEAWDSETNPLKISQFGAANTFYHRKYAKSGNVVYCFWDKERNDTGCGLSWWDTTQATNTITVSNSTIVAYLKNYNVSDMFVMNGGDRLVLFCKRRVGASYTRIFIFDISSDKNLNNLTPVTKDMPFSENYIGVGYPVDTNIFVGISHGVTFKVNITDLDNITFRNLPGYVYGTTTVRPTTQTADGKIWMLVQVSATSILYELDPVAFSLKKKTNDLGQFVYGRGLVSVGSSSIYFLGGTTGINADVDNLEKLTL